MDDRAFGVQGFLCHWHKPDEVVRLAGQMADAGIGWARESLPWGLIEPEQGTFQFENVDFGMQQIRRHGIKVVGLFGGGAKWAAATTRNGRPHAMPRMDLWAKYVRMIVERYGDVVAHWEATNEPNHHPFWHPEPNPAEYAEYLAVTYETIKSTGHPGHVMAMNTAFIDCDFMEQVLAYDTAKYCDVISVHPYAVWGGPETSYSVEGLDAAVALLKRHGVADPRIWITETGLSVWPTGAFAVPTQHLAADYQVRMHTMLLSHRSVDGLFVHSMRDTDPRHEPGAMFMTTFGFVRRDLTPRATLEAYATTIRELEGMLPVRRLAVRDGSYAYEFANGDRRTIVCWKQAGVGHLELSDCGDSVTVVDRSGEAVVEPAKDGTVVLRTGASPQFVRIGGRT